MVFLRDCNMDRQLMTLSFELPLERCRHEENVA